MTGPDPAIAAVRRAVAADLSRSPVLPDDALVLVACSGGADSLALAAATAFLAADPRRTGGRRVRAGAAVVDHGWSPDSARVAALAARGCTELGLAPVRVLTVDCSDRDGGPEAAARRARYAALARAARESGADAVLLGHTLDDQAETVLLGLARGSGARSLAGMADRTQRDGVGFRRPLVRLSRAITRAACAAAGLSPWQDPANEDPAYARSRLRTAMAALEGALGPGLTEALARTAELAREDAQALENLAAELADRAAEPGSGGGQARNRVRVDVLAEAPDAVRRRALLVALRRAGCPPGALGRVHVLAVDALVTDWRGQGPIDLPGGVEVIRECGRLTIVSPPHSSQEPRGRL